MRRYAIKELLQKYNYPSDKTQRVINCIINHRSSKNTTTVEELCVADADIIAHFYNLSSSFVLGIKNFNFTKPEQFISWFVNDYNDLSNQTKQTFKHRFNNIMKTLFTDLWDEI